MGQPSKFIPSKRLLQISPSPQRYCRTQTGGGFTTSAGLAEVAAQAGLNIESAALAKGFAQLLLESDDAMSVRNFDNLGWDMGEPLWAAKTWKLADQA